MSSTHNRDQWSSNFTFILGAVGSAIGLGNIWRFPYITGVNGGGAFVLIYLLSVLMIGIPIFIAEVYIGQKAQCNAIAAFHKLHHKRSLWQLAGWFGFLGSALIMSFYCVVGGWVLDFEAQALLNQFSGKSPEEVNQLLNDLFKSPVRMIFWLFIFMSLSVIIVMKGVKKGIEKCTKILMPALFVILIGLTVWSMFLPGFGDGLRYLFTPDFSKVTSNTWLTAVGQAFFSLSLGMGTMLTYGSYLNKDEDLTTIAVSVTMGDTLAAVLSAIVVFSFIFSFSMEPLEGPGLVFSVLPSLFNQLPGGYIIAVIFFLLVAFAALTSAISPLEMIVTYFHEVTGVKRKPLTVIVGSVLFVFGVLCALSFNVLNDVRLGKFTIFDLFDGISANILLPLSGIIISLFVGWFLGRAAIDEAMTKTKSRLIKTIILWSCRVIAPICVTWVLVTQVYNWLF